MRPCPDFEDIAAVIDGEYEGDPATVAHHLTVCAECARTAAEIELVNMAVRANEMRVDAPSLLTDWIDAQHQPVRAGISRRQALGGLALAACAVAAGVVLMRGVGGRREIETTLFRDFATLVETNGRLDFEDRDPLRVLAWFEARVPFALPRLAAITEIGVRGGRLCWLLERRVAALHLGSRDERASLYITEAEGLTLRDGQRLPAPGSEPVLSREGGIVGAFWRDGRLAFGLVGVRPEAAIGKLAERLRLSG